jgi:hypothetical protein
MWWCRNNFGNNQLFPISKQYTGISLNQQQPMLCMNAGPGRKFQRNANPDIALPSIPGHRGFWTQISYYTAFRFAAALKMPPQLAMNTQWLHISDLMVAIILQIATVLG